MPFGGLDGVVLLLLLLCVAGSGLSVCLVFVGDLEEPVSFLFLSSSLSSDVNILSHALQVAYGLASISNTSVMDQEPKSASDYHGQIKPPEVGGQGLRGKDTGS